VGITHLQDLGKEGKGKVKELKSEGVKKLMKELKNEEMRGIGYPSFPRRRESIALLNSQLNP
jgi:hypothetical protein